MPETSEYIRFLNLVEKSAGTAIDETLFWKLQSAARDAIMSVEVTPRIPYVKALAQMVKIAQLLLGGESASIILNNENYWSIMAATGKDAENIVGSKIDIEKESVSATVIKSGEPYYFSEIDTVSGVKKNISTGRHATGRFCSFPIFDMEKDVAGALNVSGMPKAHPLFVSERFCIDGVLIAIGTKITKLKKIAEVQKLKSGAEKSEKRIGVMRQRIEKFEETETFRERMLYMTIHDFKNPLSLVISNLSFLEHPDLNVETKETLELSRFGLDRLLDSINSTLDTYHIQSDKMVLRQAEFDLVTLVKRMIVEFTIAADLDDVTMKFHGPDSLLITCDEEMIRRVVVNLLDNALRFSPMGGVINVSVKPDEWGVFLSVEDSGEGISYEDQEAIFDPFTQAQMSKERGTNGHGIGLSFCRMAVNAHGGDIRVESEPGKGARFTVALPKNGW